LCSCVLSGIPDLTREQTASVMATGTLERYKTISFENYEIDNQL